MVFASPHSGRDYPADLLAASRLDASSLRRSEDSFVDELFGDVPALGAPLIKALYPRAYLDPNREPYELDPTMFAEPLPAHVNVTSARVAAGLGTIARVVANGAEIYARKLSFAEAERRVQTLYRPYHAALRRLIDDTVARFGYCMLVDCHSMPSGGGDPNRPAAAGHGAGRLLWDLVRARHDGGGGGYVAGGGILRHAQRALRGRFHHAPLWPARARHSRDANRD